MKTDEILQMIWPVFRAEGREIIQSIAAGVLALEAGKAEADTRETVHRLAHSLKGSAASVGLEDFVALAHAIEDALVSGGTGRVPHATAEAVFKALDAMDATLVATVEPQIVGVEGVESLVASLRGVIGTEGGASPVPAPFDKLRVTGLWDSESD